jgi:hypothetical protein
MIEPQQIDGAITMVRLLATVLLWVLPVVIASNRSHPSTPWILLLAFIPFLGWIPAMAWACNPIKDAKLG